MEFYIGRYRGKKVSEVVELDPRYCCWFISAICKSKHKNLRKAIFNALFSKFGSDLQKKLDPFEFIYYTTQNNK
jgi:hypothetical protein